MIRLIGGLLICGGSLAVGGRRGLALTRRRRGLARCAGDMEELARRLSWNAPPLGELLAPFAEGSGPLKAVYCRCLQGLSQQDRPAFSQLWREGVEDLSGFTREDQGLILEAGELLGRYDRENQAAGLRLLAERLRNQSAQAGEEERRLSRVYWVAGGAAGLVAALMLL